MESDSWSSRLLPPYARRYQSRSDLFGHEETDRDDDLKAEFLCPFCAEDFDVVGLCCHIDEEHPVQAKNGICPVCAKRVGSDLRKRRFRKAGSNSTFSLLRKELREGNLQALLGGSQYLVSSNAEPDTLLSSFIYNPSPDDQPASVQPHSSVETSSAKEILKEDISERNVQQSSLSGEDQEENARKCKFVQGLLLSTIFDDL
ncbi:hypothetical protein FNV43_RR00946 [Rhamnella rubrinervis]|uniref:Uncharacterized protein n=1 Tax=Rhamnella rubrinervis TaxID=2594499 RepID=A0A8K0HPI0_9ROSA|nr:hypothetical protein FNV43_RR00946 [Rhamnella rubrinervis]